jgi:hypothetical protein
MLDEYSSKQHAVLAIIFSGLEVCFDGKVQKREMLGGRFDARATPHTGEWIAQCIEATLNDMEITNTDVASFTCDGGLLCHITNSCLPFFFIPTSSNICSALKTSNTGLSGVHVIKYICQWCMPVQPMPRPSSCSRLAQTFQALASAFFFYNPPPPKIVLQTFLSQCSGLVQIEGLAS